jgi:hypothetical protein
VALPSGDQQQSMATTAAVILPIGVIAETPSPPPRLLQRAPGCRAVAQAMSDPPTEAAIACQGTPNFSDRFVGGTKVRCTRLFVRAPARAIHRFRGLRQVIFKSESQVDHAIETPQTRS